MRAALATAIAVLLSLTAASASAANAPDRQGPIIELYTMGPGEPLPERFGHSALCVRYPDRRGGDRCYDYGAFDASEPLSLGYRFLRGESVFFVAMRDPDGMIRHYIARDRNVWRQTLPLSPEQAREAAAVLAKDARPENRYYHYHHYFDNCSTRVRDIIDGVAGGALTSVPDDAYDHRTFRDYTREGFAEFPALLAATELFLGRAVDAELSAYDRMFLPEALLKGVEAGLGAEADLLYVRRAPPLPNQPGSGSPWFALTGLALFAGIIATAIWGRHERLAVALAAVPLALVGLILWTIAMVSPLEEIRLNELLLVFVPLDVVLPFLSARRRYAYTYARLIGISLIAVLAFSGVFVQPLINPLLLALLPLSAIAIAPGWKAWRAFSSARRG